MKISNKIAIVAVTVTTLGIAISYFSSNKKNTNFTIQNTSGNAPAFSDVKGDIVINYSNEDKQKVMKNEKN